MTAGLVLVMLLSFGFGATVPRLLTDNIIGQLAIALVGGLAIGAVYVALT